ncbi:cytochrome c heme-lyase [Cladophialophora yegresii CBS 114405]|uniref:Holocytochrome c-type synthase n=1 Tax=Cladophialophora yegresii CBS 114405 TaxID=1182544 RepID=W9VR81_9EURO|nr:cytochrome c heme-lyase [Cladophialophora yegresii CBS 114405]EXJ58058.1 cytochrome c heme-lyase [Cladophialophora yegresii CBS 114405]
MGWFWADPTPRPSTAAVAPHNIPTSSDAAPPPGCPMHKSDASTSSSAPFPPLANNPPNTDVNSPPPSSCPVKAPNHALRSPPPSTAATTSSSSPEPANASTLSKLNPLNYMPSLSNVRAADSPQSVSLPLSRETSSIPRTDSASNWEYPSPQQMYNAMLRKGYTDTPAEHVEAMVAVHNFLNEGAWAEIEDWEAVFSRGLGAAWQVCSRGEEGVASERARRELVQRRREMLGLAAPEGEDQSDGSKPKLIRFQGRPKEPTPKARMLQVLGTVFPSNFSQEPPFDRHDWYVSRRLPDGSTREVRYVIDYYGGGVEEETGQPVFYLDIRPALDSPTAAAERAMRWGGDVWWRASGGAAREAFARAKERERNGS